MAGASVSVEIEGAPVRVAATIFAAGSDPDAVLAGAVERMRRRGLRLGGVLQRRGRVMADGHCEMLLEDLRTGQIVAISQDLGCGAEGCRLDPVGLAQAAALVDASVRAGIDVLVLNRFGRAESDGGGLLDLLGSAAAAGIPVVTAVSRGHTEEWEAFAAGWATVLPLDPEAIAGWCEVAAAWGTIAGTESCEACDHAS